MSVKIMIDSASDLTEKQALEAGMLFMPIYVQFGSDEYLDGVNMNASKFYDMLEQCEDLPTTSLINEYVWSEAFEKELADGSELIVITISSKLSGTYRAAESAARKYGERVRVIDSLNATFAEALLGLYAVELRDAGRSFGEIADLLEEKKKLLRVYAVIDTLKYLKKGGRISAAAAMIGTALSIKPIIAVIDGEVKVISKAMGSRKALQQLSEFIRKDGADTTMPLSYIYSGNDRTNIERYVEYSKDLVEGVEVGINCLGCTIGTHIGAGAVGLVYFKKQ